MNKITGAIDKMRNCKLPQNTEVLDLTFKEYCRFQELKSLAAVEGALTLEEAQTVYTLLGVTPECFNRQDYAVKAVLTLLFARLLKWHNDF